MRRITEKVKKEYKIFRKTRYFWFFIILLLLVFCLFFIAPVTVGNVAYKKTDKKVKTKQEQNILGKILGEDSVPVLPVLDKVAYDKKINELANNPPQPAPIVKKITNPDGSITEQITQPPLRVDKWPVKTVYPNTGAILPFNRIIAYYGNLYSKKMGVLGEYEEDIMLTKLKSEVKKWEIADPETPVIPALHYIAVVAQGSAGSDGKYRFRMPDTEIEKVLEMAKKIDAIVFLDIQVALSDIQTELPFLKKYLELPNVHLGIDPEFSMKTGAKPGKVVGTMDGEIDINYTINYLSKIVEENNLPPKVLVVHRYTQKMVTNYTKIKPTSEVQVVMHMDGWGGQQHKISTYQSYIYKEPVQFTGFKIFYKNDTKQPNTKVFEPEQLLKLSPQPIYIQYQ